MVRLLLRIHFVLLGTALCDALLYYKAGISFRGQRADILLSVAPLVTALAALFAQRSRPLRSGIRTYLIAVISLNLLLTPVYFLGTIPVAQACYDRCGRYEARQMPGMLAPRYGTTIMRGFGPFEQALPGLFLFDTLPDGSSATKLERRGDSLYLKTRYRNRSDSVTAICRY